MENKNLMEIRKENIGYYLTICVLMMLFYFNPILFDLGVIGSAFVEKLYFDFISISITNINLFTTNQLSGNTVHVKPKQRYGKMPNLEIPEAEIRGETIKGKGKAAGVEGENKLPEKKKPIGYKDWDKESTRASPNRPGMYGGNGWGWGGPKRHVLPGEENNGHFPIYEDENAVKPSDVPNGKKPINTEPNAAEKAANEIPSKTNDPKKPDVIDVPGKKVKEVVDSKEKKEWQEYVDRLASMPHMGNALLDYWTYLWSHTKQELRLFILVFFTLFGFSYPYFPKPAKNGVSKIFMKVKATVSFLNSYVKLDDLAYTLTLQIHKFMEAKYSFSHYYVQDEGGRKTLIRSDKVSIAKKIAELSAVDSKTDSAFIIILCFKYELLKLTNPRLARLIKWILSFLDKIFVVCQKIKNGLKYIFFYIFKFIKIVSLIIFTLYLVSLIKSNGGGGSGFLF